MKRTASIVALVVVAVAITLLQTSAGHALLRGVGLVGAPPDVTELAFSSPNSLPTTLAGPRGQVDIAFVIRNDSVHARSYRWRISQTGNETAVPPSTAGTTWVASGAATTVRRSVYVGCAAPTAHLQVTLPSVNETLSLVLTCLGPSGGRQ